MTLTRENELMINMMLTQIAKREFKEDLVWVRTWTKEEFNKRNYKEQIKKILIDYDLTLNDAIDDFITDYYPKNYNEDDKDKYVEMLHKIVEAYYLTIEQLNKEYNNEYKEYTKESLSKMLKWDPTNHLFGLLYDDIIEYDNNPEGLKALILA